MRSSSAQPQRRRLSPEDYQALGAFRHALRRFLAFSESGAQALGLTPQQHQALLAVRAHPGPQAMSVSELASALMIRNHSALGLVERLVERGLLARGSSNEDRRRVLLTLTDTGARKLETISRNNLGELKSDLPVFTELLQALEQLDVPAPPGEPPGAAGPKAARRKS
ncbi:MarR family winged helix-turn-helix transcriptional regulator [Phenylobacterium sp.]|jgi:DNA-binding MarR family transcriptional regulator|uniref:MarR family winged helix-turn-helix transcriptional regulator n=1 Tax=Phenylobacterium sp. TaxID=1871053 RepID=UPI002EDB8354